MAREEAAPTFETWRHRLEAAQGRGEEVERFLQVLRAMGTPLIDGSAVTFVYHDPQARLLRWRASSTNGAARVNSRSWSRSTTAAIFHYTLNLSEPARLEYKFIVDDEWKPDPLCH